VTKSGNPWYTIRNIILPNIWTSFLQNAVYHNVLGDEENACDEVQKYLSMGRVFMQHRATPC
jgi:hypothetical protein